MNRILISGCGDIAMRVAPLLSGKFRLFGLVRRKERHGELRAVGITPVPGDLDNPSCLGRIAGLADIILHFAPPPPSGDADSRTRHLLNALARGSRPKRFVYLSTSGVYGDCGGAWVTESYRTRPLTPRARRRLDAERQIRAWAIRNGICACILRVPGIYANDRLPLERLRRGIPAIVTDEDSYTNHIHADDLARIITAAIRYGRPNRIYHASDDSDMKMGDYFDAVADCCKLPRPERLARKDVCQAVSTDLWSFLNESRRLTNERVKQELKVRLRYPAVRDALADIRQHSNED